MLLKIVQLLSRVTSRGTFIPQIDGLRFLAIMSVVLFHLRTYVIVKTGSSTSPGHYNNILDMILSRGYIGVSLFFCISGFILAMPFIQSAIAGAGRISLKKYYLRRFTRIEPPYILNLVLIFILLVLVKKMDFFELFPHLLASSGYMHNAIYGTGSMINTVAWSLEIEIQFYLLLPVFAVILQIRRHLLRRGLLLVVISAGALIAESTKGRTSILELSLIGQLQYFFTGILLADIHFYHWRGQLKARARQWAHDALFIFAAGLAVIFAMRWRAYPSNFLLPVCFAIIFKASFHGALTRTLLTNRWITIIGGMCYTVYLYHHFIISFVGRYTAPLTAGATFTFSFILQFMMVMPVMFFVCAMLFIFIEKPFMSWNMFAKKEAGMLRSQEGKCLITH